MSSSRPILGVTISQLHVLRLREDAATTIRSWCAIGPPDEVRMGRASIFDIVDRSWIRIIGNDPGDTLHKETVRKMLDRGAKVVPAADIQQMLK